MMHAEYASRFHAKVQRGDGCWLWQGSRLPSGYGRFYPKWKVGLYAHRVAWEIANDRPVPDGLVVMHACDNPQCVRPEHLSVGTSTDNMLDAASRGRLRPGRVLGEEHWNAKLTNADVVAIRESIAAGERHRDIADRFGVTRACVSHIGRRVSRRTA